MGYWVAVDADAVSGKPIDLVKGDAAGGRLADADLSPGMMASQIGPRVTVSVYAETAEVAEAVSVAVPAVLEAFAFAGEPLEFQGVTVQTEAEWERINFPEGVPHP
ncbi:hypothetical protein ACSNN7_20380 [Micromonospora sp. URMC 105]|uniref:hypothetical protein n=1 Tax=Micromonospora sp. URMC 105 TaxID=3423413 RepID=UPI003F1BB5E0